MIKNVIWDFDGTLFDTYPAIAGVFLKALERFGISEKRACVLKMLHQSLSDTYDHFSVKYSIDREELRNVFVSSEEGMDVNSARPFDGVPSILGKISQNGGSNLIYTNRGKSTYDFLEKSGLTGYFTEIITFEDGFGRKPSPDCINYFVDKYSFVRGETLMVGDREIDVLAAHNAGIKSCYFNSHQLPIPTKPHIYIDSIPDLLPHIIKL